MVITVVHFALCSTYQYILHAENIYPLFCEELAVLTVPLTLPCKAKANYMYNRSMEDKCSNGQKS